MVIMWVGLRIHSIKSHNAARRRRRMLERRGIKERAINVGKIGQIGPGRPNWEIHLISSVSETVVVDNPNRNNDPNKVIIKPLNNILRHRISIAVGYCFLNRCWWRRCFGACFWAKSPLQIYTPQEVTIVVYSLRTGEVHLSCLIEIITILKDWRQANFLAPHILQRDRNRFIGDKGDDRWVMCTSLWSGSTWEAHSRLRYNALNYWRERNE